MKWTRARWCAFWPRKTVVTVGHHGGFEQGGTITRFVLFLQLRSFSTSQSESCLRSPDREASGGVPCIRQAHVVLCFWYHVMSWPMDRFKWWASHRGQPSDSLTLCDHEESFHPWSRRWDCVTIHSLNFSNLLCAKNYIKRWEYQGVFRQRPCPQKLPVCPRERGDHWE